MVRVVHGVHAMGWHSHTQNKDRVITTSSQKEDTKQRKLRVRQCGRSFETVQPGIDRGEAREPKQESCTTKDRTERFEVGQEMK